MVVFEGIESLERLKKFVEGRKLFVGTRSRKEGGGGEGFLRTDLGL